jgi:hypothetical protein
MKLHYVRFVATIVGLMLLSVLLPAGASLQAAPSATDNSVQAPKYDDRSDPVRLLTAYYNAVNRQEYQRAYGYWESPPRAQTLAQFTQGYATTKDVLLAVNSPTQFEGAAGSAYTSIPTVLVATHKDGSVHTFAGCYVARRSNVQDTGWHIYSASIKETPANASAAALLTGVAVPACGNR